MEELIGLNNILNFNDMDNHINFIMHDGSIYDFKKSVGGIKVFISEDERSCLITDLTNDIQFEIRATTICNSGFLKVV